VILITAKNPFPVSTLSLSTWKHPAPSSLTKVPIPLLASWLHENDMYTM